MVKICVGSLVKICASSLLDMWRLIDKENRCVGSLIRRCTGSLVNRTYVLAHWLKGTVSQDFYPFSNSFKLNFCSPSWPLIDILKCSIYEYCMANWLYFTRVGNLLIGFLSNSFFVSERAIGSWIRANRSHCLFSLSWAKWAKSDVSDSLFWHKKGVKR